MKNLLFVLCLCMLILTSCGNPTTLEIKGKIDGLKIGDTVLVQIYDLDQQVLTEGSATVKDGTFMFSVDIDSMLPYKAQVVILPADSTNRTVKIKVLDLSTTNDHLTMHGKLDDFGRVNVEGGFYRNTNVQAFSQQITELQERINPIVDSANKAYETGDSTTFAIYFKQYNDFAKIGDSLVKAFIKTNPNLTYAAYLYFPNANNEPADDVLSQFEAFSPEVQASPYGQRIRTNYELRKQTAPGAPIPVFTVTDLNGKEISPAQFHGKYLLIDFWGSWCRWCRVSSPKMVQLYKEYHSKGLEILGLAYEGNAEGALEKIKTAIAEDGYTWPQANISERNDITEAYSISGFPTYVLADTAGNILLCGSGTETLDKAIEIIKEKIK